jgi:hypothetical protein
MDEVDPDYGLTKHLTADKLWDASRPVFRDRVNWWLLGRHQEPAPSFDGPLEDPRPERTGICCSGGGIRSASFNLGALQALQQEERLQEADYLAAVSGGSYIAAAFSMVAKTDDPDDDSDPKLVTLKRPPFYEGSPEEQYLRNRASYLAPAGMGKVLLVWRIAAGLVINLVLIASVLALLAAALALYYRHAHPGLVADIPAASPSHRLAWAATIILLAGGLLGVSAALLRPRFEALRQAFEMWSVYLVVFGALVFSVEVVIPELIEQLQGAGDKSAPQPALSGRPGAVLGGGIGATVASILVTVLLQLRTRFTDPTRAVSEVRGAAGFVRKLGPRIRAILISLVATLAGPLLVVAILVAATIFQVDPPRDYWLWLFPVSAAAIFVVLYYGAGDLTSWSLHPYYRRRLCTAFALKRVPGQGRPGGIAVERKQGKLVPLSKTHISPRDDEDWKWPALIVCAAANISDPGATPPGRGVTSFTFSPWAMGGPLVGGIGTKDFEDKLPDGRQRDLTLPAAVAMSGAAVSPSMGKLSRPSLRFLMGLANVRLGVWVPNPRRLDSFANTRTMYRKEVVQGKLATCRAAVTRVAAMDEEDRTEARARATSKRLRPRPRPRYLLKELLGWNSVNDKYLYVTDGGHYENLGLVELLRRGCMNIYCFDASGGASMKNLGDAIALARSELGVEITFDRKDLESLREKGDDQFADCACAVGRIRYTRPAVNGKPELGVEPELKEQPGLSQDGYLVYAPTVITADTPWDVHAFRETDAAFPHHSTVDQLFTDQKFEAYRVLGRHAAFRAMETMDEALAAPVASDGAVAEERESVDVREALANLLRALGS